MEQAAQLLRRGKKSVSAVKLQVGDVAATAGLTLRQAEDALKALAADTLATLQVRACIHSLVSTGWW